MFATLVMLVIKRTLALSVASFLLNPFVKYG